jgi:hypothetical protein
MAQTKIIRSVAEFLEAVNARPFLFDLGSAPVAPWYLGQGDAGASILPGLYKSGIKPDLEREMLRDFRMLAAEFIAPKSVADWEWLVHAHQNGVPTRIIEWMANPLAALFHAVEGMSTSSHGKVWVFNPWAFNESTAGIGYVPMVDSEVAATHVVNLTDPTAWTTPVAELPMALRPYRGNRPYNTQGVYYTIHGFKQDAIDHYKPLLKRNNSAFVTFMLIDADRKKAIMKELYGMNVTRAALIPGLTGLSRTLTYRYSKDYILSDV